MKAGKLFKSALFFIPLLSGAQTDTFQMEPVSVAALMEKRPLSRLPSSVSVLDSQALQFSSVHSFLPAANNVAGVRMEERSPGSYRFSIRGSLLRSPFGVRNVKVYIDEMPLTNAGGETYLNLIDHGAVRSMEIHKGPDGSLFGANSGGVLRLNLTPEKDQTYVNAGVSGGSYQFWRAFASAQRQIRNNNVHLHVASQGAEGYRSHSAMTRHFLSFGDVVTYDAHSSFSILLLGSFLNYETPGGLTFAQMSSNGRMSRPATAALPGTEEQKAGISNNTMMISLTNEVRITDNWTHVICFFGSLTDFKNPFITNYETRGESNAGFRTWLRFTSGSEIKKHLVVGTEQQLMKAAITNHENLGGEPALVLARDKARLRQGFVFTKFNMEFYRKLTLDLSLSMNFNKADMHNELLLTDRSYTFEPQLMPRLALGYSLLRDLTARAVLSRGYSTPTLQELRPSSLTFTAGLQPEQGLNYEAGLRYQSPRGRLRADVCGFVYRLGNAIARRADSTGAEYFVNSGGTEQPGFEGELSLAALRQPGRFLRTMDLGVSATYYTFRFSTYSAGTSEYSGNQLTGVPPKVFAARLSATLARGFFLYAQLQAVEALPLNDANTEYAKAYQLLFIKLGWTHKLGKTNLTVAAGCDNVLDQRFSLGNDLNAFGGRFYNPAAARNYFIQLACAF